MCVLVYSKFYNNYEGLAAFQYNEDNAKVAIEDVTAKNNELDGVYLTGTGITVNNANIKNNGLGLWIGDNVFENEITLAGDVTITNNKYGFYTETATQGIVYVTGDFNLNRNDEVGLSISENFTLAVGGSYSGKSGKSGSGSITACDNTLDIVNFGGANFEGTDYTCVTTDGPDVPKCKPCYPGCPSPEPDESSFETQQIASSMVEVEAEYLELADMRDFIVRN